MPNIKVKNHSVLNLLSRYIHTTHKHKPDWLLTLATRVAGENTESLQTCSGTKLKCGHVCICWKTCICAAPSHSNYHAQCSSELQWPFIYLIQAGSLLENRNPLHQLTSLCRWRLMVESTPSKCTTTGLVCWQILESRPHDPRCGQLLVWNHLLCRNRCSA